MHEIIKSLFPEIENKIQMAAISTSIQHCIEDIIQCNNVIKIWAFKKNKTVIVIDNIIVYSKNPKETLYFRMNKWGPHSLGKINIQKTYFYIINKK